MSRLKQPEAAGPQRLVSGRLSKVTGAGIGTGLIVLAEIFELNPKVRLVIQCLAPSIAIAVAAIGPYVTRFLSDQANLLGLKYIRKQIQALERSVDDAAPNKADLRAKTQEVESMIAEHLANNARSWRRLFTPDSLAQKPKAAAPDKQ